MGITYDAGALIAAENDRDAMKRIHARALAAGEVPVVPAGVLGQVWRGGPQARLSRLLRSCLVEPLSEVGARRAGALCDAAGTSDTIDASVVAGAIARGDIIITSDPSDMAQLSEAAGVAVPIIAV